MQNENENAHFCYITTIEIGITLVGLDIELSLYMIKSASRLQKESLLLKGCSNFLPFGTYVDDDDKDWTIKRRERV